MPVESHRSKVILMSNMNGLMQGKRGLVMGVANNRSIAWGIAKALADAGAEVGLTYQGDALKKRVEPLAAELDGKVFGHCDVTDNASMDAVFVQTKQKPICAFKKLLEMGIDWQSASTAGC